MTHHIWNCVELNYKAITNETDKYILHLLLTHQCAVCPGWLHGVLYLLQLRLGQILQQSFLSC